MKQPPHGNLSQNEQTKLLNCCQYLATTIGFKIGYTNTAESNLNLKSFTHKKLPEFALQKSFEKDKMAVVQLEDASFAVYIPMSSGDKLYTPENGFKDAKGVKTSDFCIAPNKKMLEKQHKTRPSFGNVIWFLRKLDHLKASVLETFILLIFINAFVLALPLFTMNVYDKVVPNFATDTLFVLATGVIIIIFFDFIFRLVKSRIFEKVNRHNHEKLSYEFMERTFSEDLKTKLSKSDKINLYREMISNIDFFTTRFLPSLLEIPFVLAFLLVIYLLSPSIFLVPFISCLIIILISYISKISIQKNSQDDFAANRDKLSDLHEKISMAEIIKTSGDKNFFMARWNALTNKTAETQYKLKKRGGLLNDFCYEAVQLQAVLVIVVGVFEINKGNISIGTLIACSILSARAISPILAFGNCLSGLPSAQRSLFFIKNQLRSTANKQVENHPKFVGNIKVDGVSLNYQGKIKPALSNVTVSIAPNAKLGIIGRTGSGKTSLIKALLSIIKPTTGSITIDGIDTQKASNQWLSDNIGYVPQNNEFFKGSILDNISMGRSKISEEKLQKLMQISGINSFLGESGKGLDTEISEGGSNLSGGQKQSIAIARAIYHDPKIIIFDEATNGLDQELEKQIRTSLKQYLLGKTFILCTHRSSMLELVDNLLVIEDGKILAVDKRDKILSKLKKESDII